VIHVKEKTLLFGVLILIVVTLVSKVVVSIVARLIFSIIAIILVFMAIRFIQQKLRD